MVGYQPPSAFSAVPLTGGIAESEKQNDCIAITK